MSEPAPSTHAGTARGKVLDHAQLLRSRDGLRSEGKRLIQCHGCFDIVHPGHIRHLRQARSLGDALLVSITGDEEMRKGTGRPLIPQELRAENLAALDCVDFVYIEPRPTALELLREVRPDIYVKGREYENNNDPRFQAERQAVEAAGGRVVFSSGDVVFSSTALIAALERSADPFHARLVELLGRDELQGAALFGLISSFRGKRVVIVGEAILDTYVICDRPEVAGESPVLTLRPLEARHYDGGAAVIARHVAALGARPTLVCPLPDSPEGLAMKRRLLAEGIDVRALPCRTPVPEKQRFLVGAQKIMKVDLVEPYVLDAGEQQRLLSLARDAAGETGGVEAGIVADFGLGLFSAGSLSRLCAELRPRVGVLAGDVSGKRSSLRAMTHMDLLCPSETELRDAMRMHAEGLPMVVWKLLQESAGRRAIVTLGADGLIAFERLPNADEDLGEWRSRLSGEHVPALCPLAVDPLGCGDSLLAAGTLALASGGPLLSAAYLGACTAAVQVQRLGNVAITGADLRQTVVRVGASRLAYAGAEAIQARATPGASDLARAS